MLKDHLAETAWKERLCLAMSDGTSIFARDEIVVGIVSLDGIAEMSELRNDGFGVRNQYAKTP